MINLELNTAIFGKVTEALVGLLERQGGCKRITPGLYMHGTANQSFISC